MTGSSVSYNRQAIDLFFLAIRTCDHNDRLAMLRQVIYAMHGIRIRARVGTSRAEHRFSCTVDAARTTHSRLVREHTVPDSQ